MVGNIIDYLEWYGDFGFDVLPFNEVDNLILAELSYAGLGGIVPEPEGRNEGQAEEITVREAADRLFKSGSMDTCCKLEQNAGHVLYAMAEGKRFGGAKLCNYVNKHDFKVQEQFAALHVKLSDGTVFVSFAGTDDTLLGWKEDLNMSYLMPVPSQEEAVRYLESTLLSGKERIRIGGHSKGGNLAIYAAMMCDQGLQDRILMIYNNDGPGFRTSMVESGAYKRIEGRIHTIVPETSIIGMLLEHVETYEVVKSVSKGIMQHDGLSWQVYRDGFVKLDERSRDSLMLDAAFSTWIGGLSDEQRVEFVDAVYELLTKAGIHYLSDLEHYSFAKLNLMVKEMSGMDPKRAKMVRRILRALLREYGKNVVQGMKIASSGGHRRQGAGVPADTAGIRED